MNFAVSRLLFLYLFSLYLCIYRQYVKLSPIYKWSQILHTGPENTNLTAGGGRCGGEAERVLLLFGTVMEISVSGNFFFLLCLNSFFGGGSFFSSSSPLSSSSWSWNFTWIHHYQDSHLADTQWWKGRGCILLAGETSRWSFVQCPAQWQCSNFSREEDKDRWGCFPLNCQIAVHTVVNLLAKRGDSEQIM